jgi:diguanylate cyclase (GGDEF)-like protein
VLLMGADRLFDVVATEAWPGALPESFEVSEEPALLVAMRTREPVGMDEPACAELATRLGVPQLGIAPLFVGRSCKGMVLVVRRSGAAGFDSFTQQIILTLTLQTGVAIDRVLASQALLDRSLRDELTGVGNRRAANQRLERLEAGDALLMLDLDHFKRINDTKGHAAGDAVLSALGQHLTGALRDTDDVYRMGGEEFLVVLAGGGSGALQASERLLEGWRLLDPVTTFSGGIATHREGSTGEATLALADGALYEAKDAGRDRIVAFRDE